MNLEFKYLNSLNYGEIEIKRGATDRVLSVDLSKNEPSIYPVPPEIKEIFSKIKGPEFQKVVIAYEPDWAIGTKTNCSPDNALTVALFIKKVISENFTRSAGSAVKILYGGSVDSSNAKDYLIGDSIGGLLVGGASLDIKEFLKIVQNVC